MALKEPPDIFTGCRSRPKYEVLKEASRISGTELDSIVDDVFYDSPNAGHRGFMLQRNGIQQPIELDINWIWTYPKLFIGSIMSFYL